MITTVSYKVIHEIQDHLASDGSILWRLASSTIYSSNIEDAYQAIASISAKESFDALQVTRFVILKTTQTIEEEEVVSGAALTAVLLKNS